MESLLDSKLSGILVEESADYLERLTGRVSLKRLRLSTIVFSSGFDGSRHVLALKRLMDIVVSTVGLILVAPLMLLTAVVIKLDSSGPVFFRQERLGRARTTGGRGFRQRTEPTHFVSDCP